MTPIQLPEDEAICDINVTPLVDISLVLVIIFMVVAPFLSQILKPIRLPNSSKVTLDESNSIKVSLFSDGTLAVNSSFVEEGKLPETIQQEVASGKTPWVVMRAGEDLAHGRVMEVMAMIKKAGIERVAFAAKPKPNAGGAQ